LSTLEKMSFEACFSLHMDGADLPDDQTAAAREVCHQFYLAGKQRGACETYEALEKIVPSGPSFQRLLGRLLAEVERIAGDRT